MRKVIVLVGVFACRKAAPAPLRMLMPHGDVAANASNMAQLRMFRGFVCDIRSAIEADWSTEGAPRFLPGVGPGTTITVTDVRYGARTAQMSWGSSNGAGQATVSLLMTDAAIHFLGVDEMAVDVLTIYANPPPGPEFLGGDSTGLMRNLMRNPLSDGYAAAESRHGYSHPDFGAPFQELNYGTCRPIP